MTGAVWVLVLFVSVFFVVLETSAQNKARERIIEERQEQEALKKSLGLYVGFYKDSLCASQYKKEWVKHLEIRNHTMQVYKYVPKEYTFTSVSKGGITTGGVSTYGGFYNRTAELNSDRGRLFYFDKEVKSILLNEKIYQKAKNTPIEKFIKQKKRSNDPTDPYAIEYNYRIEYYLEIVDSSYESALALYIGNDQSKQVHYNLFVEKALKTIDELTQIVDWLYTISD